MTIGPSTLIQAPLRIGERLCASNLISIHQLQTALYEQGLYQMLRLGEILVLHGWVRQKTADFFGDQWPHLDDQSVLLPIGRYFSGAGLINRSLVEEILLSQQKTGLRFGALAVLNGYIQQATLDFFIEQFFPEHLGETPYMIVDPENPNTLPKNQFILGDKDDNISQ